MSMITEQVERLRKAADFRHTIGDYMTAGLHREAADTIEAYQKAFEDIRAEIQAKYDSIPYRYNDNDDGWIEGLEWVLEIIDKHTSGKDAENVVPKR